MWRYFMRVIINDLTDNDRIYFETDEVPNCKDKVRFDGQNEGNKIRIVKSREFMITNNELWQVILDVDFINAT
jgi:hypothetical protein